MGMLTGSLFFGLGHQPQDARTFFGASFMVTPPGPPGPCPCPCPPPPHTHTHTLCRPPGLPPATHPGRTTLLLLPCLTRCSLTSPALLPPPQIVLFMMFGAFPQLSIVQDQKRAWYKHREARMYPAYAQVGVCVWWVCLEGVGGGGGARLVHAHSGDSVVTRTPPPPGHRPRRPAGPPPPCGRGRALP
jgi:hypothetical protein